MISLVCWILLNNKFIESNSSRMLKVRSRYRVHHRRNTLDFMKEEDKQKDNLFLEINFFPSLFEGDLTTVCGGAAARSSLYSAPLSRYRNPGESKSTSNTLCNQYSVDGSFRLASVIVRARPLFLDLYKQSPVLFTSV